MYNPGMDHSRLPLSWMVFEAGVAGLRTARFEHGLLAYEQIRVNRPLSWIWFLFEVYPIKRLTYSTRKEDGLPEMTRRSVCWWLESYLLIKVFVRPHLGRGRRIHRGQKIHSSLVRASVSTAEDYIPKARPFNENPLFWEMLRDGEKEVTAYISEWLELDLYEQSKRAAEKLVDGDDTALKSLLDVFILGKLFHPSCFSLS